LSTKRTGGNWKCNPASLQGVKALVKTLNEGGETSSSVEVIVAPTFLHIPEVTATLRKDIKVSAQNCWNKDGGAFTGEIAPSQIKNAGVDWVILGHSERRHVLGESDGIIADKVVLALENDLGVIFCIGEQLSERNAGNTISVCSRQMDALKGKVIDWTKVVVAYEPVWAIGTGVVATPDQAQEVHDQIRSWLKTNISEDVAASVRIIYGGSVTAKNSDELGSCADIDGFLVGGASLKAEFLDIIKSAASMT
jgi:triosephosphate isomerase